MTPADRFKASLTELVERVMRRVRYLGLDVAVVVAQQPDGRLELAPEDTTIPGMVDVPIRHGLPGVTAVSVAPGARVRVGFDGGDPKRPYAVLWDAGNATSVTFNGGTHEAARKGHAVQVTIPVGTVHVTNPAFPATPGAPPTIPNAAPITLDGTITEGAGVLRLP